MFNVPFFFFFQDEHEVFGSALEQYQVALESLLPILAGNEVKCTKKENDLLAKNQSRSFSAY